MIALKTDGTIWGWGQNAGGCLGLGDSVARSSPVQIGTLSTWTAIACGSSHTLALKSDGTLWAWGLGTSGQIATSGSASRSSPVQVGTDTTWVGLPSGPGSMLSTSYAIKEISV